MGRYARAVYGDGKYGLDKWSEYSVEPMVASIEVDNAFSHTSSFTNDSGEAVYDRVQVSWLQAQADKFVLLRSNLGYPTSPNDPFAKVLLSGPGPATTRTNLITNPSFETDLSGWTAARLTLSRDTTKFSTGTASVKGVSTDTVDSYFVETAYGTTAHPITPGQVVTVGYDVWDETGQTPSTGTAFYYYDSTGALLASGAVVSVTYQSTPNVWQRVVSSSTAPATAAYVRVLPANKSRPVGASVWLDGLTMEIGSKATSGTYFSGNTGTSTTSDGATLTHGWNGTANASTSWEKSTPALDAGSTGISPLDGDPYGRARRAVLDTNVEPGREYFYAVWVWRALSSEWILAGRAMTTTSSDHGTLDSLKASLPPYMWNAANGFGAGVAVAEDDDDENHMTRWLQSTAWQLDKSLTKVDLLRKVWDPQYTPAVLLDEAVGMFGLPVEPALGERAHRALLSNAATITGDRGTLGATSALVESLTGLNVTLDVGKNMICNPAESSFESLTVAPGGSTTVTGGTGRWWFTNATLTRVAGDPGNSDVRIARAGNSDDDFGNTASRWGLRLDSISSTADMSMTLGEKVKIASYVSDAQYGTAVTAWPHGLEEGDVVTISLDNGATSHSITVQTVVDSLTVRFDAAKVNAALVNKNLTPSAGYFSGGMIPVYQGVPVTGGEANALVGMFQAANRTSFTLSMTYYDRFGTSLGTKSTSPTAAVPPAPSWTQVFLSEAAPAGTAAVTLAITSTQNGSPAYLTVDSLMVRPGGTVYDSTLTYEPSDGTPYNGNADYTYEDARLLTLTVDTATTPAGGVVPATIRADLGAVLTARMTDILSGYLPCGTAFRIKGLTGLAAP